jgi:hypothetical protein
VILPAVDRFSVSSRIASSAQKILPDRNAESSFFEYTHLFDWRLQGIGIA